MNKATEGMVDAVMEALSIPTDDAEARDKIRELVKDRVTAAVTSLVVELLASKID
jgi:hypothetical protein